MDPQELDDFQNVGCNLNINFLLYILYIMILVFCYIITIGSETPFEYIFEYI